MSSCSKCGHQDLTLRVIIKINKVTHGKSPNRDGRGWQAGKIPCPPPSSFLSFLMRMALSLLLPSNLWCQWSRYSDQWSQVGMCVKTAKCSLVTFTHKAVTWPELQWGSGMLLRHASLSLDLISSLRPLSKWRPALGSPQAQAQERPEFSSILNNLASHILKGLIPFI